MSAVLIAVTVHSLATTAAARYTSPQKPGRHGDEPSRVLVISGSSVHNVGELQMHLLNWGEWGSRPGVAQPYSFAPSAQWPAGSGIEYLFSAGLWIGALKNGIPAVSTAAMENEFRPSQDPRDIVYKAHQGDTGGERAPAPGADDDGDGSIDEDPLDGYDNDRDGSVDEDFAAISTLMMTCRYTDDQPVSTQIYPEHNPLHLSIRQESYQWDADRYDDFIGVEYHITNAGEDALENVFVGMFVDGDVGRRDRSNYWEDDMTAFQRAGWFCSDVGPVEVGDIAYVFDADGDGGRALGRFGVTFIGHPTDPNGQTAPFALRSRAYAHFSGHQTFLFGGDPTNDFERYEILSRGRVEPNSDLPRDYRFLLSQGPFLELGPGETIVVQMAWVIGGSDEELLANATNAKLVLDGAWFDLDGDRKTGVSGRETPFYGPTGGVWVDSCRSFRSQFDMGCDFERVDETGRFNKPAFVPAGQVLWANSDCLLECIRKSVCGYIEADSLQFRTGVGGRETNVKWLTDAAPPAPRMRIDDHARDGVVVYWDNFSEVVRDPVSRRFDFEGYRVWRADDWTRPLGTSIATGPPSTLWSALLQADIVNNFGEDTGLDGLRYSPLGSLLDPARREGFIEALKEQLMAAPGDEPPCPPGVTPEVCDTLKALARAELALDGGREYYRYIDESAHMGAPYFYAVVGFDHDRDAKGQLITGSAGDPASNFTYVEPKSAAQPAYSYDEGKVYVVPNPATRESMAAWALGPTNEDPSGVKIEFRNLPRSAGVIRIYTLAGDLVHEIHFDGRGGNGTVPWDLVSRNGQSVTSGIYLYSIEFDDKLFKRVVDKFTIIR